MSAKSFLRHNWFRHSRLGLKWRRPKGRHSKVRENRISRPVLVRAGYRTKAATRDLHPTGLKEIIIANVADLQSVDPKTHVARIKAGVGVRKRVEILKAATEKKIKILNTKQIRVTNRVRGLEAKKKTTKTETSKEVPRGAQQTSPATKGIPRGELEKQGVNPK